MSKWPLILASTSRYRRELLERLNIAFSCAASAVDESNLKATGLAPLELSIQLAQAKAKAVALKNKQAVIIGSDQVADLDGLILDKPGSKEKAIAQLELMSGKQHLLHTAVSIVTPDKKMVFVESTKLRMRQLNRAEVVRYVEHDQPYDCAGSYKIEALGISLFESIECQDFTAITGLPLMQLAQHLREIGYELP